MITLLIAMCHEFLGKAKSFLKGKLSIIAVVWQMKNVERKDFHCRSMISVQKHLMGWEPGAVAYLGLRPIGDAIMQDMPVFHSVCFASIALVFSYIFILSELMLQEDIQEYTLDVKGSCLWFYMMWTLLSDLTKQFWCVSVILLRDIFGCIARSCSLKGRTGFVQKKKIRGRSQTWRY